MGEAGATVKEAEQAGREQKRERSVAVVGILATAVLGLAGIAASWLISRDDRGTQRALAHDARVYSAKAAVYEEAFAKLSAVLNATDTLQSHLTHHDRRAAADIEPLRHAISAIGGPTDEVGTNLFLFGSAKVQSDYLEATLNLPRLGSASSAQEARDAYSLFEGELERFAEDLRLELG
jgi:hypothetical protein